jgi:hypothetical protein
MLSERSNADFAKLIREQVLGNEKEKEKQKQKQNRNKKN